MLQFTYGLLALSTVNLLAYWTRIQVGNLSKVSAILLVLMVLTNLIASFLPALFCELWGLEYSKVKAVSLSLWFCLACGVSIGFLL